MMKKMVSMLLLISSLICNAENNKKIEIVYLTANAYCPSVEQIEIHTKQVVDSLFGKEKDNGTIIEKKLNIFDDKNQDFIHKWEISTNGLVFIVSNGDKKEKVDLNDFAFSYVPSDITYYKKELENKIKSILNNNITIDYK